MLADALRVHFVVFFEQGPRKLDAGGHVLKHCFRTGTLRMQEHPQGFGKDDLVFENGALDFIHHLHRKGRRAGNGARQPKGERFTSFARWSWCARSVARRVLCAAPDAALRVPSAVPDAVPRAPLAVPDAARCRTLPYLQAAAWARWA